MKPLLGIVASQITGHLNVPPPVSGYSLWLDASDTSTITSSSGAVSNWLDKSTNAYNFAQSTSTYKPTTGTRTINSKNVIDFDGTNDGLKLTSAASVMNYLSRTSTTWFMVGATDDTSTTQAFFATEAGSASRTGVYILNSTSNKMTMVCHGGDNAGGGDNRTIYVGNTTTSIGSSSFYATVKSAPTAGTAADRVKGAIGAGTFEGSNTFTGTSGAYNEENPMTIAYLWDNLGGGDYTYYFWNGAIGEILIYPSALSPENITLVQDYLEAKWGL